jgi:hypothetical protein
VRPQPQASPPESAGRFARASWQVGHVPRGRSAYWDAVRFARSVSCAANGYSALGQVARPLTVAGTDSDDTRLKRGNWDQRGLVLPERCHVADAAKLQHVERHGNAGTDCLRGV